jgi:intracellular multiplication protein IcmJ
MPLNLRPILLDNRNAARVKNCSAAVVRTVHRRDHDVCQYCGLRMRKYQTLVQNGENWRDPSQFATACIFCQQCFYVGAAGRQRSAVVIHAPAISQAELNRLAFEVYVARLRDDRALDAKRCLDVLMSRREHARQMVGTDDPAVLAERLDEADRAGTRVAMQASLAEIRLFGLDRRIITERDLEFNQFPQLLAYMRSGEGPYRRDEGAALPRLDDFLARSST